MSKLEATLKNPMADSPIVSISFQKNSKVQPTGYSGLMIDQEATVILKGKITRIGASSWEVGSKGFDMVISSCEISGPVTKVMTIDDAVKAASASGKKVK